MFPEQFCQPWMSISPSTSIPPPPWNPTPHNTCSIVLQNISLWPLRHATELHTPPHFVLQLSLPLPPDLCICLSVLLLSAFILPLTRLCRTKNREKLAILPLLSLIQPESMSLWQLLSVNTASALFIGRYLKSNWPYSYRARPDHSQPSPAPHNTERGSEGWMGGGTQESSSVDAGHRQLGLRAKGTFCTAAPICPLIML